MGLKGVKQTLDLGFDIVDGVGGFDLEGDGFAREGLDENLHLGLVGGGASLISIRVRLCVYGAASMDCLSCLPRQEFVVLNLLQMLPFLTRR